MIFARLREPPLSPGQLLSAVQRANTSFSLGGHLFASPGQPLQGEEEEDNIFAEMKISVFITNSFETN